MKYFDGLINVLNKAINIRQASNANTPYHTKIGNKTLNDIYKGGVGNKIVRLKVNTALKEGFTFKNPDYEKIFYKKVFKELRNAMVWQLVFGRGVLLIAEKSKTLTDPLMNCDINSTNVFLKAFDGSNITATVTDRNLNSERYNKPEYYMIEGKQVHYSRVIDFTYVEPIEKDKPLYNYGGISEFELIYEQIINDGVVQRASASVLDRSATPIYKVKGFKQALQANRDDDVLKFYSALETARNNLGAVILDSEDSAEVLTQTLTGLMDTDTITLRRLAMVTGIPLSLLIGENVKGMNSSGDNEMEIFYSTISQLQMSYLYVPLNELCEKINIGEIDFNSPDEMTKKEKAMQEGILLDNATKMYSLGLDYSEYLKENGFKIEEIEENFSEFEIDANDEEDNFKKEQEQHLKDSIAKENEDKKMTFMQNLNKRLGL